MEDHSHPSETTPLRHQPPTTYAASIKRPRSSSRVASVAGALPSRSSSIRPRKSYVQTWRIRLAFLGLAVVTCVSSALLGIFLFNTRFPTIMSPYLPSHRGSRSLPPWYAFIATWLGSSSLARFWMPEESMKISLCFSLGFLFFDLVLISMIPELLHQESLLTLLTVLWSSLVAFICLETHQLVKKEQEKEALLIQHGSAASRDAERRARILFMEDGFWRDWVILNLKTAATFFSVFVTSIVLFLMTFDLLLRATDSSVQFPFKGSKLYKIRPPNSPVAFRVHLACTGPTTMRPPPKLRSATHLKWSNGTDLPESETLLAPASRKIPTILFESLSGVSGTEGGRWLMDMRDRGDVGRVCVWDRPGYAFSDASANTEMGHIVESLMEALQQSGEKGPFLLVGAGYGGLISRVFSARNANQTHSHLFIDAHSSNSYFLSPHRNSPLFQHYFSSLITAPLSLSRITRLGDHRITRITSPTQNGLTASTLAQEAFLSHSRYSPSFKTLLGSLEDYPADAPTIVLSSAERMREIDGWRDAQTEIWEEVVDEKGRVRWTIVDDDDENGNAIGHDICASRGKGRRACKDAVMELLWA